MTPTLLTCSRCTWTGYSDDDRCSQRVPGPRASYLWEDGRRFPCDVPRCEGQLRPAATQPPAALHTARSRLLTLALAYAGARGLNTWATGALRRGFNVVNSRLQEHERLNHGRCHYRSAPCPYERDFRCAGCRRWRCWCVGGDGPFCSTCWWTLTRMHLPTTYDELATPPMTDEQLSRESARTTC